jgi:drug/metabolite transporter (DMT)-like permease
MAGETLTTRLEGRVPPTTAVAVGVLAVSTSAILLRWSAAPPTVAAFYRVVFTTALLAPLALTRHGEQIGSLGRRDVLTAGATGLALAVHLAAWFQSVEWTSVAAAVTLVQAQALFVAIGGWALLDEHLGARKAGGIALALAGMAMMSAGDLLGGALVGPRPLAGNALAVVGAVTMAAYVLAGRSLRVRVPLVPYVTVVYSVCAAGLLGVALVQDVALLGYPPVEWGLFLAMAAGPGVFGHTALNWALEHVEPAVVSVSLLGEPVVSTLLAMVLLAEIPGRWTVVGGAVVLAGIAVTARGRRTG